MSPGLRNALVTASLAALVGACATQETAPGVVKQAVAEPPCSAQKVPARPVFPADTLTGAESIWVLGTTLWADRKARRAYEAALEVFAQECTRPAGAP